MKRALKIATILLTLLANFSLSANRLTHYKAPSLCVEPRLPKKHLGTLEVTLGGGNSTNGVNIRGKDVNVLNIYGPENFRHIAKGVPTETLNKNPGAIIDNLWNTSQANFGLINLSGKFKFIELNFDYTQNWKNGFFAHLNLPFRNIIVKDFTYTDLSTSALAGTTSFATWQAFSANLVDEMKKYDINLGNHKGSALGDTTLEIGWTQSYVDTKYVDFWDTTIRAGVMIPTAPRVCPEYPIMVSSGYNKNFAVPMSFDVSLGLFEWLTFGGRIGGVLFIDKYQTVGMKTAKEQNGLIKLATGMASVHKGNIFELSIFGKSDHMPWGLSLTTGYSYTAQHKTILDLPDNSTFDCSIVNTDLTLCGWDQHTIHVGIEYDFAIEPEKSGLPKLNLNLNFPVDGRQIFDTSTFNGSIGVDFAL